MDRIAPLERNILRLAVWEIETEATPPEVAIDEAVRLAKRYSTDEAGSVRERRARRHRARERAAAEG